MARPKKAEVQEVKPIRVVATKIGYYGKRIREGEEFSLPENLYSKNWMRLVGAPEAASGEDEADAQDVEPEDE